MYTFLGHPVDPFSLRDATRNWVDCTAVDRPLILYCMQTLTSFSVDGSCAKHLTVESYSVIYAANSRTYYY